MVATPSINTCGVPLTMTTMTTRRIGIDAPPLKRNKWCSGERLSSVNDIWKPLAPTSLTVTDSSVNASITTLGAGTGTRGPDVKLQGNAFKHSAIP